MFDGRELARKLFMNAAHYSGLASAVAPSLSGIGTILMLHRVNDEPATELGLNRHLTITPRFLDTVLTTMKRMGYTFVSMDEAVECVSRGSPQARFATITLDDGYLDNLTHAVPVFEAHGTPFTIYVAPALTEGRVGLWWEMVEEIVTRRDWLVYLTDNGKFSFDCATPEGKREAARHLQDYLTTQVPEQDQQAWLAELMAPGRSTVARSRCSDIMNWDEIRRIAAHPLGTIGAHTVHHYNLRRLALGDAEREIAASRDIIAIETGTSPRHFAYPYGYEKAVGEREVRMVREAGFASAVTTRHGMLQAEHRNHLHALPRLSVNGRYQQIGYVRTMLSGLTVLAESRKRLVTV
ncbi:polysaccharide deacetylase family protein [Chelativorans sp. ZYF759]|uniref:polysaccharide deacetylase family protein n=1 Tax=Chelativorans sp. ZYF759 TaxID=2692213 RepID=UPI00145C9482|nr:polysaccharide deacetylase family protein [Chelativorans sp. ZYF759]NMG41275.1 polysaccharide deacetylase family protein [Chelativorans sp. ZYF759]